MPENRAYPRRVYRPRLGNYGGDIPPLNDEVERLHGVIEYQKKEILLLKRHLFELERQLAEKNAE